MCSSPLPTGTGTTPLFTIVEAKSEVQMVCQTAPKSAHLLAVTRSSHLAINFNGTRRKLATSVPGRAKEVEGTLWTVLVLAMLLPGG